MTDETVPPLPAGTQPAPSNGLGVAGFVVSLGGLLFTCGILCPVGLILSLVALRRYPRGLAIAGSVIGGLGTLLAVIWGFAMVVGLVAAKKAIEEEGGPVATAFVMISATTTIEMDRAENGRLPDSAAGTELIADLRDGWQRALRYEVNGESYTIRSAGADGAFDTTDDITEDF